MKSDSKNRYIKKMTKLILSLIVACCFSCNGKKDLELDNKLLISLDLRDIYSRITFDFNKNGVPPTAQELIRDLHEVGTTPKPSSFPKSIRWIYYYDGMFDSSSNRRLAFCTYRNSKGDYIVILRNGKISTVKKLPKVSVKYYYLDDKE